MQRRSVILPEPDGPMMQETVIPWLVDSRGHDKVHVSQTFQTYGISESGLDEAVAGLRRFSLVSAPVGRSGRNAA